MWLKFSKKKLNVTFIREMRVRSCMVEYIKWMYCFGHESCFDLFVHHQTASSDTSDTSAHTYFSTKTIWTGRTITENDQSFPLYEALWCKVTTLDVLFGPTDFSRLVKSIKQKKPLFTLIVISKIYKKSHKNSYT